MSAERMVMAYGENGPELTPESKVVYIPFLPLGPGNVSIPATVRFLSERSWDGGGIPTELIRVEKPTARNGRRFVYVTFKCTPYVLHTREDGTPLLGEKSGCSLRHEDDVNDPVFDRLTPREIGRLRRAVREVARQAAA